MPLLGIIIILVLIIIGLIIYNFAIHKKIKNYSAISEKISNLNVLQDFIDTIGKDMTVSNKIEVINDIIIQKFNIKYSTIVVFNGAEYIMRATNVEEKYWDALKNLHTQEIFKDSIMTATPKYITVDTREEKLPYQGQQMGRAKSAIFFPLYIDNIYIGYWIIESNEPHAVDKTDTSILGVVRENIVSVLRTVSYQNTIENIYRIDKTTGLNSAEYIYGKGKNAIDKYPQSTICMFTITNIQDINRNFSRDMGTDVIVKMTNLVKSKISSDYIFVRYMGPKFSIVFSGIDETAAMGFVKAIKKEIEKIRLSKKSKIQKEGKPNYTFLKTNFVLGTYYKGTGIEEVTKKLEEYLDEADIQESNINCI